MNEGDRKIIAEIIKDIKEIKSMLYEIRENNTLLKKDIYGNGKKGLITHVEQLEEKLYKNDKYIYFLVAIVAFVSFLPSLKNFVDILK